MNLNLSTPSLDVEDILRDQSISRTEPGPILRDVETMLGIIEAHDGLRVSAKQQQLYYKRLPEINEELSFSTAADYDRPTQKAYPYVHGLYLLVRAAGLTRVVEGASHSRLALREEMATAWRALNPTEQYMALLEAWIHRANEEELMDSGRQMFTPLFRMSQFLSALEGREATFSEKGERERLNYYPGFPHLALMHLFGWIELDEDGTAPQQPWILNRVALTPVGGAMISLLVQLMEEVLESRPADETGLFAGTVETMSFTKEELHEALGPYFPDWEQHLTTPDTSFTPGVHTLRVHLAASPHGSNSFEARLAAPGAVLLDAVAGAILNAAAFDRDHLYEFQLDDAFGREQAVSSPMEVLDPPYTDEVRLGDLPLEEGASLTFRFDFGAEWHFGIEVASITPNDNEQSEIQILDATDHTPEQYPGS